MVLIPVLRRGSGGLGSGGPKAGEKVCGEVWEGGEKGVGGRRAGYWSPVAGGCFGPVP